MFETLNSTLEIALTDRQGTTDVIHKADALAELAVEAAALGQTFHALKILAQALQIAQFIPDPALKDLTLWDIENTKAAAIALKLAESGNPNQALQIAKNIPNQKEQESVLQQIIVQLAITGRFFYAIALLADLSNLSNRNQALAEMAIGLANIAQYELAVKAAQLVEDQNLKASVLETLKLTTNN